MIINVLLMLLMPFVFIGIVNKTKAVWAGRKGAPVWQPFSTFFKLLRKGEVQSRSTGFIFSIAPSVAIAAIFCAGLFVPFGYYRSILSFQGDFILFAYLLSLAKAVMVLGAMDTASSFEGMGASREMSFTVFLEPAMFLVVASLSYLGGLRSLSQLVALHTISVFDEWSVIIAILTAFALFIMLLVEGARVPFDDPNTHLELTMVHEVMVLDNSGINLAFIHYAAALKMLIYASLISYFLIPWGQSGLIVTSLYLGIVIGLAILTGLVESFLARFRMNRNLEFVAVPLSLAILVLAALVAKHYGGI